MAAVTVDGNSLTIEDLVSVARRNSRVALSAEAREKVERSRAVLERLVQEGKVIYGVTTGFGALSKVAINPDAFKKLQANLIRSHAAGVGKPLSREAVRALMLLRVNTLAKGNSGVKLATLEALTDMLNKGVHPVIPEEGSVGASGDLAPLSHMALVLIGEGEAEYDGKVMRGGEAMRKAGVKPVELDFKEGIALNNGTQMMTALAALAVFDAEALVKAAEIAAALSLEAMKGISDAFDKRIQDARPQKGQGICAENLRALMKNSKLIRTGEDAAAQNDYPQDPYSLRCTPQVLGAARDAIAYVRSVVEVEINSATDNPLVFPPAEACLSGGNFHGQPVAAALDFLAIALATVGNVAERRIARLIDENLSRGLPAFLIPKTAQKGISSGLMTAQYTAAALASENKVYAHPASVDSIPTSANFEDFVSMGPIAARKAWKILQNTQHIVAIEMLCAAQGIDYRGGSSMLGNGTRVAYLEVRKTVPALTEDRPLSSDIESVAALVRNGKIVEEVAKTVRLK